MNDNTAYTDQDADKGNVALRVIVLGALYALAVAFTVAFSPSMGVVRHHHPTGEVGPMASMEAPARR
ncbi:MAG: hypothetical protein H7Z12_07175 [Rhodospirillaceae bacterium]|nr:hypothetical protein [Rhodospirillales bacterium]